MKQIILLGATLLTLSTTTQAQIGKHRSSSDIVFMGPIAGFGDSWAGNLRGSNSYMPSGSLGLNLIRKYKGHFAWGAQALVSSEGYKINDHSTDIKFGNQPTYTPVYFRTKLREYYYFSNYTKRVRPEIHVGVSGAWKVNEFNTTGIGLKDLYLVNESDHFRRFDWGVEGGAGVNVRLSERTSLCIDLGYYNGLTDSIKDPGDAISEFNANHDLDLSVGVVFGMW